MLRREPAQAPLPRSIGAAATHGRGKGVLIGIVDVGGFDFAHPDFLDDKAADALRRDLGPGQARGAPPVGRGFDYGSEFTKQQMDAAI